MPRLALAARRFPLVVIALAASCSRGAQTGSAPSDAAQHPLAAYAAQRIAVTPAGHVRGDSLGWVQQLGGARRVANRLDTAVVAAFTERGLASRWVMPADLVRSFERNRTYAADPHQLALEQVRAPAFVAASRYGEPLSTQLRTMIALHQDTRYVLVPIELRFEKDGTAGRSVLRAALLDPRSAEARWVGDVRGDTSRVPARALASVATRLADLFVAP